MLQPIKNNDPGLTFGAAVGTPTMVKMENLIRIHQQFVPHLAGCVTKGRSRFHCELFSGTEAIFLHGSTFSAAAHPFCFYSPESCTANKIKAAINTYTSFTVWGERAQRSYLQQDTDCVRVKTHILAAVPGSYLCCATRRVVIKHLSAGSLWAGGSLGGPGLSWRFTTNAVQRNDTKIHLTNPGTLWRMSHSVCWFSAQRENDPSTLHSCWSIWAKCVATRSFLQWICVLVTVRLCFLGFSTQAIFQTCKHGDRRMSVIKFLLGLPA